MAQQMPPVGDLCIRIFFATSALGAFCLGIVCLCVQLVRFRLRRFRLRKTFVLARCQALFLLMALISSLPLFEKS